MREEPDIVGIVAQAPPAADDVLVRERRHRPPRPVKARQRPEDLPIAERSEASQGDLGAQVEALWVERGELRRLR